ASRIAQELALSAKPYQRKDQRKEIAQLRTAIRARLLTVISKECWPVVPKVIGSSGTIKAVMSLCKKKKNPKIYKVKALRKLVKTLSCSSTFRPRHHRRIPAWRAETILGAAILLEEIIEALGAKRIALTRYSLTQGLLNQEILCRQLQKATEERRRSIPALPLHCQAA
ncbi:MAG TPA: hypothetical protein PLP17_17645, partial [Oligoflexia bacterium]|nr:hypothetical protein [Oligoflexia bacterium]